MILIAAGRLELLCTDCGKSIEVTPSEGQFVSLADVAVAECDHVTEHIQSLAERGQGMIFDTHQVREVAALIAERNKLRAEVERWRLKWDDAEARCTKEYVRAEDAECDRDELRAELADRDAEAQDLRAEVERLRAKVRGKIRCSCGWCCSSTPPEMRGETHKMTCGGSHD